MTKLNIFVRKYLVDLFKIKFVYIGETSMKRTDEEITEYASKIASEAWKSVNDTYRDSLDEALNACECMDHPSHNRDDHELNCPMVRVYEECDIYLYCYDNRNWVIENSQYLQDHRNIVAAIPLQLINGPAELAKQIEQNYDSDSGSEDA
jgi:hypothetical protein